MCETTGDLQPPTDVSEMFQSLAIYQMPKGSRERKRWQDEIRDEAGKVAVDTRGALKPRARIPPELLPPSMESYVRDCTKSLADYAQRTIRVLVWRNNLHMPLSDLQVARLIEWSLDNTTWHLLPQEHPKGFLDVSDRAVGFRNTRDDIEALVTTGRDMPIGHELFEEAWSQWGQNPRSALVIGMAAVEAGLKDCVADLVPSMSWFVEPVQSPPISSMLAHVHEIAAQPLDLNGEVVRVPKYMRDTLTKGANDRNHVVHRGAQPPNAEGLREILFCAQEFLYLLDGYCGDPKWAVGLRPPTMVAMGIVDLDSLPVHVREMYEQTL